MEVRSLEINDGRAQRVFVSPHSCGRFVSGPGALSSREVFRCDYAMRYRVSEVERTSGAGTSRHTRSQGPVASRLVCETNRAGGAETGREHEKVGQAIGRVKHQVVAILHVGGQVGLCSAGGHKRVHEIPP